MNAISHATITLRKATVADAAERALLDDIAGHGMPSWLWQAAVKAGKSGTAFAFGRRMMMEETPVWGWRNAIMAEVNGQVAGMVTSYRMPRDTGESGGDEPVLKPVFELMREAEGDWYIDALAVHEEWRGRGVASQLVASAVEQAVANDCAAICLIVSSDNTPSRALYEKNGFRPESERQYIATSGEPVEGKSHLIMRRVLK